jgi:hypothetical protein
MLSEKIIKLDVDGFKCTMGAVDGKDRPTSLYFVIESKITPKLSMVKSRSSAINRPQDLADSVMEEFLSLLKDYGMKHIGAHFCSSHFDPNSVICFISSYPDHAEIGLPQNFALEINIDTINSSDSKGNPKLSSDGKVYNYNFKDFEEPAKEAVEKLLSNEIFSRSSMVKFDI